jgi:hypothetical protein
VPEDFPRPLLSFINWIILAHVAVLVFYLCGLAKEIFIGPGEKKPQNKTKQQ